MSEKAPMTTAERKALMNSLGMVHLRLKAEFRRLVERRQKTPVGKIACCCADCFWPIVVERNGDNWCAVCASGLKHPVSAETVSEVGGFLGLNPKLHRTAK